MFEDQSSSMPLTEVASGTSHNASLNDTNGTMEDDGWDAMFAEINEADIAPELVGFSYLFKDIRVQFPYEAYISQIQMMEKIIQGVTTGENCLLESPTGTGKTAAILCALLAWQKDCYARRDFCQKVMDEKAEKMGGCTCGFIKDQELTVVTISLRKGEVFLKAITYAPAQSSTSPAAGNETVLPTSTPNSSPSKNNHVTTPTPTLSPLADPCTPQRFNLVQNHSSFESPLKKLKLWTEGDTQRTKEEMQAVPSNSSSNCSTPVKNSSPRGDILSSEERPIEKVCGYCVRKHVRDNSRPPRIYYCTRTHSQIAQVVKQLKNTAYKGTPMTILSSREPTCISELKTEEEMSHQQLSSQERKNLVGKSTINDICRASIKKYWRVRKLEEEGNGEYVDSELRKGICKHYLPKSELKPHFEHLHYHRVFDLDDIKKEGESCEKCPYFGCYSLHDDSDIIFCSYNYLIDPSLRKATNIYYPNSVVVFDEAHNIEDICRESFSLQIDLEAFDKTVREYISNMLMLANEARAEVKSSTREKLQNASVTFKRWSTWIKEKGKGMDPPFRDEFVGDELTIALAEMEMTSKSVRSCLWQIGHGAATGEEKDPADEVDPDYSESGEDFYYDFRNIRRPFRVSSTVAEYLQRLLLPLEYLCLDESEGIGGGKDFKGFLSRRPNPKYETDQDQSSSASKTNRKSIPTDNKTQTVLPNPVNTEEEFLYTFEIICLNPALAFRVLRNCTYSIIVASGTLTPLDSFASELATTFEVQLQADHVIPRANVWAGVVSVGPSNIPLRLVKDNQKNVSIQDEIGEIICEVCNVVPNGVVVFFPSYILMKELKERWNRYPAGNSVLKRIQKNKLIFSEESKNKQLFKMNMEKYKEYAPGGPSWDGCILFAVFRGKVSEGIDFADEQARAVITIGIPYSNAGAPGIIAKKEYNDSRSKNRESNVLTGSAWYTTQAFRAMNQGFGRCVRHRKDWGSLIMIESRMSLRYNQSYISGWIRENLKEYPDFKTTKEQLADFIAKRKRFDLIDIKRSQIQIAYEPENRNALETTEVINSTLDFPGNGGQVDEAEEITQAVSMSSYNEEELHNFDQHTKQNGYDLPTQIVTARTTAEADEEHQIDNVPDSSPEYSFVDEIQETMNPIRTSTPEASLSNQNQSSIHVMEENESAVVESNGSSSSSPSQYERSRSPSPRRPIQGMFRPWDGPANESDQEQELRRSSETMQIANSQEEIQLHQIQNSQTNQSDIMDVSMPDDPDQFSSSGSSLSYHSD